MSSDAIRIQCKDNKESKCENFPYKCEECTYKVGYTALLVKPHKNYMSEILKKYGRR